MNIATQDWYLLLMIAAVAAVAVCAVFFGMEIARARSGKNKDGRKRLTRHVRFTYRSERGVQTIQHAIIYEIEQRRGRTYLNALCMPNRAPRTFRLDRVDELIDLEMAEKPENVELWLETLGADR